MRVAYFEIKAKSKWECPCCGHEHTEDGHIGKDPVRTRNCNICGVRYLMIQQEPYTQFDRG